MPVANTVEYGSGAVALGFGSAKGGFHFLFVPLARLLQQSEKRRNKRWGIN
jgi:hypothetical protein